MDQNTNPMNCALIVFALLAALLQTGCAAGDPRFTSEDPAGFFQGLWHGVIAVVAFIISLFSETVKVYESNNNGGWYDFGFLMGIICIWGGSAKAKWKHRKYRRKEAEWEEIGQKVEQKVMRKLKELVDEKEGESPGESEEREAADPAPSGEKRDAEWEEIGKKIEQKIKRKLKKWAEEE